MKQGCVLWLLVLVWGGVVMFRASALEANAPGSEPRGEAALRWHEQAYATVLEQLQAALHADGLVDANLALLPAPSRQAAATLPPEDDGADQPARCRYYMRKSLAFLTNQQTDEDGFSYKKNYRAFLTNFREALTSRFYEAHRGEWQTYVEIFVLQRLAFALFSGVELQTLHNDLTQRVADEGGLGLAGTTTMVAVAQQAAPQAHPSQQLGLQRLARMQAKIETLPLVYEALRKGKSWFGLSGRHWAYQVYLGTVSWAGLDPSLAGSLLSVKFRAQRAAIPPLTFIRMPTPTIGSDRYAQINPEFKAYLSYLRSQGLKHTYVNYQNNHVPKFTNIKNLGRFGKYIGINNESHRARIIEKLSEGEFKDTLTVLTLAKDSNFYHQRLPFDTSQPHNEFIDNFIGRLFDGEEPGYYVPTAWRGPQAQQRIDISGLLYRLSSIFFGGDSCLSRAQRQIFLDLAYTVIADYAGRESYSLNQTCKDGIDRAGGANALSYTLLLARAAFDESVDADEFEKHLDSLVAMLFSDALLSKNREIVKGRLDRYEQASLYLLKEMLARPTIVQELHTLLHLSRPSITWTPMPEGA